ncbi:MAG TPA: pitrilysin family protein [Pyrinomonadaceae bacterium]|nr:pitrilysin family protein [Pyrinomonadaceae bacterium]
MKIRNTNALRAGVFLAAASLVAPAPARSQQVAAGAQQTPQGGAAGQSLKGAQLKGKVPVNREVLKVNLPKPQEATLKNGLRLLLVESHNAPTFTMQMVVMSGGLSDPAEKRGRAAAVATLLREGTQTRTSREIAEAFDALGSTFNAGTGTSSITTSLSSAGLVENLDRTLDLFADVARNPKFAPEEIEKYKSRLATQLQLQRSVPGLLAQAQFNRAVYGEHPAAYLFPSESAIKGLTREDLAQYHAAYYRPNNAVLAVLGDVTMKELLPKVERVFGDWRKGDAQAAVAPAVQAQTRSRIFLIDRPGSVQTTIILGNLAIERTSPDYFPLLVMNQVLGGDPSSRLFMNLREDKGYTYGAYSHFSGSKFPGTVWANADVRTEVTEGALAAFMYELKRIGAEKVTPTELENAKRAISGGFATALDFPQSLLSNVVQQQIYGLPADYWETYPRRVAAVTAEDVARVAQKYLNPSAIQIVAVGDAAKTRAVFEKYATVEVFDTEGKPVPAGGAKGNN